MGRTQVRAAAQSFFAGARLPGVGTVFAARPLVVEEGDYEAAMTQFLDEIDGASSAVLVVNIPRSRRQRRADTGRGAVNDSNVHEVALEVFFAHTSGDGVQAQTDHDTLCDAIVTLIRSDPLLGQPQTVWSAGEFAAGITLEQHEPFTNADGTAIFIPAVIHFETWEWVST